MAPRIDSFAPELAIVVPTYRHPVLLAEALHSALRQRASFEYVVVVCSDGCPFLETDVLCSALATASPRLVYLRTANRGPSAARNFAIDYALAAFASLRAVYFLDADNLLSDSALETGYRALREPPAAGWVYSHIDSFGIKWAANYAAPYSPLLHTIHENLCDTGSFVSRAVFEAGVRFNESALNGYEDWDFWLQAVSRGFRGRHAAFGFSYRQRPESRFREINRLRGSMLDSLRKRHAAISKPQNLALWEHRDNPRYLLFDPEAESLQAFTDPAGAPGEIAPATFEAQLWASLAAGDEIWTPAYFVFARRCVVDELVAAGLAANLLLLMERDAKKGRIARLTLSPLRGRIEIDKADSAQPPVGEIHVWMAPARMVKAALVAADGEGARIEPVGGEIQVRAPLRAQALVALTFDVVAAALEGWRGSAFASRAPTRWAWRPAALPDRSDHYDILCRFLSASEITPRLPGDGLDVGVIVPIASYGGAEKVGYALARTLRRTGRMRTHLFVFGAARMDIVPEFADAFDSVNFLADPEVPMWGGPQTIYGQAVHLSDAPETKTERLTGLLAGLDLVVNCHSAPANSAMGALRRAGVKTLAYLHLIDFSDSRRPVGHPYITLGFEHAYDLIVTCSRRLAGQLHALGVPDEKILPIANAASFSVSQAARATAQARRSAARGARALRCLYLGRLDHQKGVERLFGCVRLLRERRLPLEFRMVGSNLVGASAHDWPQRFQALGVTLEPPVFASDGLAELYGWADALLLPSRWEGAPLVIPECQQLGCIPVCVDVGAVRELLADGEDGLLVADGSDETVAAALARQICVLIADDPLRRKLAAAGMARAAGNRWEENFTPLLEWIDANVKPARHPARIEPEAPETLGFRSPLRFVEKA